MGEILRAIMSQNCIDSRPAFYSLALSYAIPTAALALSRRQASLQCKSDTWFLVTGWTQDSANLFSPGNPYSWESVAFPSTFSVERASTGEKWQLTPTAQVIQNYNLNNFVSLAEYPLFAPAELIIVQEDLRSTIAGGAGDTEVAFVTLQGVEYQMPAGRELSYGH